MRGENDLLHTSGQLVISGLFTGCLISVGRNKHTGREYSGQWRNPRIIQVNMQEYYSYVKRKCNKILKGTVSRDGRGMLLYILRKLLKNALASDEKNVILLNPHLTMSI